MAKKLEKHFGFLESPKLAASGAPRSGRFTCYDVQWTGGGDTDPLFATFTITADELAEAAASNLLWTDQDVQRGVKPGIAPSPKRELSLGAGYPDPSLYIFDAKNADDIATKLLAGDKLFLSPLVWNLRPGYFAAYRDNGTAQLVLYEGKIYLPDSHHRQQAIIKAVRLAKESPAEFKRFSASRQFKVELYFLSREDEGNYFFDKNQRPKPTAMSKAYDLTTQDDLSLLAKKMIEKSASLQGNVNRVTDRLSAANTHVVTLSTIRGMMKSFAPHESLDGGELDGLADIAATFYDMLAEVRPELGVLSVAERRSVRDALLSDSAVMMYGYAAIMRDFHQDLVSKGTVAANNRWKSSLKALSARREYSYGIWSGDIFAKSNPLWRAVGVTKPGKQEGKLTVVNTGGAQGECVRVLRQLLALDRPTKSLEFLAQG